MFQTTFGQWSYIQILTQIIICFLPRFVLYHTTNHQAFITKIKSSSISSYFRRCYLHKIKFAYAACSTYLRSSTTLENWQNGVWSITFSRANRFIMNALKHRVVLLAAHMNADQEMESEIIPQFD